MAERILEIVRSTRQAPQPGHRFGRASCCGTVTDVGERFGSPPASGDRIVTLGSLTLTPLRLEAVTDLDPASPQVDVTGTAYVFDRAAWAPVPDDLPLASALEIYDVCAAASETRTLARRVRHRLRAGSRSRRQAGPGRGSRREPEGGRSSPSTSTPRRSSGSPTLGLCDVGVTADLRDPIAALEAVRAAGVAPADLTVVVVNATGLRADRDPAHRGGGHGAVLLDGDQLRGRRAGRRRDRDRRRGCWSAAATPRTAAPTRWISSAAPPALREALGLPGATER